MNSGSKVLLGVLAGAAAGAILGVLFAPEAGTETRRRLGEGSRDVANNLKARFSDLVDNIADKYESAREGASDLIDRGKQAVSGATGGGGTGSGSGTGTAGTSGAGAGASAAASNLGGGSAYQS
jgi:gas vesicle protein